MSVESFRRRLEADQSRLHREQVYRAWSFAVGIVATILSLLLSASIPDIGFPSAPDQWLYMAWVLAAWLGSIALLVFGSISAPTPRVRRFITTGLWAGDLAMAAGVAMAPLALVVLLLPIGVGAMIMRRANGAVAAIIYLSLPLLALLGSVAYQYYESVAF